MADIKKVAVIGSGVMGSGIAAHIAASNTPVVLLDIIPEGAETHNILTEKAIEKQLSAKPSGFAHPKLKKYITCGNLTDDLELLADCDLIIEAVLEKLEVKQEVYRKIDSVRKPSSIVSSNTSTLPITALTDGFPDSFKKNFIITHFFNPPRFMRLLEVAGSQDTDEEIITKISRFADVKLGKGVVKCKDTPGFIANRIGVYWMMLGLLEAIRLGISPQEADAIMGRPLGMPKTGIFGLFDLIGIDLMPLIAKAMLATLPKDDMFRSLYQEPEIVKKMIADGYTGRKGKGGFYRINRDGGKKIKEVINLSTGEYSPVESKISLDSINAAREGIDKLVSHNDIGGKYAASVLIGTLHYAASLIPEISDDILAVDNAMKWGYSWKFGPFELIDKIGVKNLNKILREQGKDIPTILSLEGDYSLYTKNDKEHLRINVSELEKSGTSPVYLPIKISEGSWLLKDRTYGSKPVTKNSSARLWDIGDGIACLELTSKMNSVDPDILTMINQSIELAKKDFRGMIIGGDSDNFSVGANLAFMLMAANIAAWKQIEEVIKAGQQSMMAIKYAPFPVVSALGGMALGGGCEIILHSNAVQAHMESYAGLVEVGVGLIPAWGGCKEMLLRHVSSDADGNVMPAVSKVFEAIATAKVAGSALEARDIRILREDDKITMNRARLLSDAKDKCLQMVDDYSPPEFGTLRLAGESGKTALFMAIDGYAASGKATEHDVVVSRVLAEVLNGGDTDIHDSLSEQNILDLELAGFMELVKTKGTIARIEHMLQTGKPLRN
ncbi:MAG: 3-hydroxyacyl-CoA dehydrogenase NAD-binding domain-containing protein [Rickettsiales bacterium]